MHMFLKRYSPSTSKKKSRRLWADITSCWGSLSCCHYRWSIGLAMCTSGFISCFRVPRPLIPGGKCCHSSDIFSTLPSARSCSSSSLQTCKHKSARRTEASGTSEGYSASSKVSFFEIDIHNPRLIWNYHKAVKKNKNKENRANKASPPSTTTETAQQMHLSSSTP